MASSTAANVGDLILVDGRPTNTCQLPAGLYVVLAVPAPYSVAPAESGNPQTPLNVVTVPQSRVIAVYHAD